MMRIVLSILAFCCIGITLVCGWIGWQLLSPITLRNSDEATIVVRRGMSYADVYQQLRKAIAMPSLVPAVSIAKFYSTYSKRSLQRGLYPLSSQTTLLEALLMVFHRGQSQMVKVTFPEGLTIARMADIASEKIGISKKEFIALCTSDSLLRLRNIKAESLEGYLSPNTYSFYKGSSADEIVDARLDEHKQVWEKFKNAQAPLRLSKHQVLTLASIVEAETPNDDEKPRVAGVYLNRLKIDMKLDADPTVQYALGDAKRRLYYKDLEIDSPFNTYRFKGLPPAPINSPGEAAIKAVIKPEEHSYLYFVAKGDGSQRHVFSSTAKEHERAVAEYRKRRAE